MSYVTQGSVATDLNQA